MPTVMLLSGSQYNDKEFNLWGRLELDSKKEDGSEMTLQDLIDHFKVCLVYSNGLVIIWCVILLEYT